MPEELRTRYENLANLTDEELAQLEEDLQAEFDRLDGEGHDPGNVAKMTELADAIDTVRQTSSQRQQDAEEAEAQAETLRNRVHAEADAETDEAETDEDEEEDLQQEDGNDPGTPDDEDENEGAGDGKVPAERARAAAGARRTRTSGSELSRASDRRPARRRTPDGPRGSARLLSTLPVRGRHKVHPGEEFSSFDQVGIAMAEALTTLGRGRGSGDVPTVVASLEKTFPEERTIKEGEDALSVSKKMDSVISRNALVATGGICQPVNVDYNIPVIANQDEPLGDALPDFNADRGGLTFIQLPTLASVGGAGTSLWTAANDANPTSPTTKPFQTVNCGVTQTVLLDAIPTRMRFGNMMGRFQPEIVAAVTALALANGARFRELYRIGKIAAGSTTVSTSQLLGASRDLLATLDLARAAYIWRNRYPDNTRLQVVLPRWARDILRADIVREMANSNDLTNFNITDAQIDGFLRARNVDPIYMIDAQTGATHNGVAFAEQNFLAQGNGGLLDWPHTMVMYMFAPGTWQRLDGGRLDIGVVRDSRLNDTNDFETFVESFENVAKRGIESLELVVQLRPNGLSAGTVNTSAY